MVAVAEQYSEEEGSGAHREPSVVVLVALSRELVEAEATMQTIAVAGINVEDGDLATGTTSHSAIVMPQSRSSLIGRYMRRSISLV